MGQSLAVFNFRSVTSRFNELVFQYPIRIPERYALVIRSLLTQVCDPARPISSLVICMVLILVAGQGRFMLCRLAYALYSHTADKVHACIQSWQTKYIDWHLTRHLPSQIDSPSLGS